MSMLRNKPGFAKSKPKPVVMAEEELVRYALLEPARKMPLVCTPVHQDFDMTEWAQQNKQEIDEKLAEHGAILFRNTGIRTQDEFQSFVHKTSTQLANYMERTTPRTHLGDNVYTSTEHPSDQRIWMHNELSYSIHSPQRLWFYCSKAAEVGGETPLTDGKLVYQRIPQDVREAFEQKGWMLVRNFGNGYGPSWQQAFNTDDPKEVEAYCSENEIEFEWLSESRLRTRQTRRAVVQDPRTGEPVWFNHIAFYHVSNLEPGLRNVLLSEFGVEDLPFNSYYGDGTPIADEHIAAINDAFTAEFVAFPWQEQDVLIVDNYLVAHGRNPFQGTRKVLVAMGN